MFVITYRGTKLSYFHSNNGCIYRETIGFSNNNYNFFRTYEEAQDYLKYIIDSSKKEMIERPFTKEVFEKLLKNATKFKIEEV